MPHPDTNRVELTGRIATEPTIRIIPPGSTLSISFEVASYGEWPDHTGQATLIEYRHFCFAQGDAAEAILWATHGDDVALIGAIDMVVDGYEQDGRTPIYRPAVRVHAMQRRGAR